MRNKQGWRTLALLVLVTSPVFAQASNIDSNTSATPGNASKRAISIQGIAGGTPIPISGTVSSAGASDTVGSTATFNANSVCATVLLAGQQSVGFALAAGTLAGTFTPSISIDATPATPGCTGGTWTATLFVDTAGTTSATQSVTNPNASLYFSLKSSGGARCARVCTTSYTSGSATGNLVSTTTTQGGSSSGTVTANIGTTGGLCLDTSVNGVLVAQASTTSGQSGTLEQGAVTTGAPSYSTGKTSPLSLTTAGALRTDGSAVTQPVSGTVTSNIGTTNGLALDSSVNGVLLSQGSTTSGQKGPLDQAAVTTSAPSYSTAQTAPLSLNTSGGLRTDGSGVTQPVSGTVTANIGTTNGVALDTSVNGVLLSQGSTTSGEKGPMCQAAVTTAAPSYTTAQTSPLSMTVAGNLRVDGSTVTQPVSGTVTSNIGTTNGLALDASVTGLQVSQGSTTSGEKGGLTQGAVTTAAPSYTTAQTSPLSLTTAGALRTDGSAVTQPISGTVTSNIGTTNGLALDTSVNGILLSQNSTTSGQKGSLAMGAVTTGAPSYTTAQTSSLSLTTAGGLRVDGSAVTQPVSGTVTSNIGTTNGLSLDTSVNGVIVSQGSTTSGEKGPMCQAAVTTAAPSYTTAQTSPLSMTTAGNLRVDGSTVTQPVSGTITSNIGTTNGLALDTSVNGVLLSQGSTTSGQKGPISQAAVTTSAPSYTTAQTSPLSMTTAGGLRVDGSGVTQPVSGVVTSNIGTTNGLALDTSVNGLLLAQGGASTSPGPMTQGSMSYGYVNTQSEELTAQPLSLTMQGALRVDASNTRQQVVAVNNPLVNPTPSPLSRIPLPISMKNTIVGPLSQDGRVLVQDFGPQFFNGTAAPNNSEASLVMTTGANPPPASLSFYITDIDFTTQTTSGTIQLDYGTGTTCTSPTTVWGPLTVAINGGVARGLRTPIRTAAGVTLCCKSSVAANCAISGYFAQ